MSARSRAGFGLAAERAATTAACCRRGSPCPPRAAGAAPTPRARAGRQARPRRRPGRAADRRRPRAARAARATPTASVATRNRAATTHSTADPSRARTTSMTPPLRSGRVLPERLYGGSALYGRRPSALSRQRNRGPTPRRTRTPGARRYMIAAGLRSVKLPAGHARARQTLMETVTLTIDGRQITVDKGQTVLQAAIEAGIKVPVLLLSPRRSASTARAASASSRSRRCRSCRCPARSPRPTAWSCTRRRPTSSRRAPACSSSC